MKINSIKLGCRSEHSAGSSGTADSLFILFRSPALFSAGGREQLIDSGTAVIITGSYRQSFRAAHGHRLSYDCISFRMSSSDKQYMAALDIETGIPLKLADDFVMSGMIKCMKSQSLNKSRNTAEFMELSMRLLFISLSDAASRDSHDPKRSIPHLAELKRLRESIFDDPLGEWNSDLLAAEIGISRAYFHRIYLAAFGVTCRQDVIESRLIYAADMLRNTDLSVSEIAEKCGYESDSYFMRQFRQHKGCTPTEYRNNSDEE